MRRFGGSTVIVVLMLAACGYAPAPLPAVEAPPTGRLLVLETEPCHWTVPRDCHAVNLVYIGLDGEELERLTPTEPVGLYTLALPPARDRIAWPWNWELYVMRLDDEEAQLVNEQILSEAEQVSDPAWSSDGAQIVYRWVGGSGLPPEWHLLEIATGEIQRIEMPVDCRGMAWSPDGELMACEVPDREQDGSELSSIFLVDMATLRATPLTTPGDQIDDRRPAWSPDGNWLAFERRSIHGSQPEIDGLWIVEPTTGEGSLVARGPLALPVWSPDGEYLAFDNWESGQIGIVGRDGSGLTMLDHEPFRFVGPRWVPEP